jgi:hypothetical protein
MSHTNPEILKRNQINIIIISKDRAKQNMAVFPLSMGYV